MIDVGSTCIYELNGVRVEGVVEEIRRGASVIEDSATGQRWPSVKFRLRLPSGARIWTVGYPDHG